MDTNTRVQAEDSVVGESNGSEKGEGVTQSCDVNGVAVQGHRLP